MAGAIACVLVAGCGGAGSKEPAKPRLRLTLVARPSQDTVPQSGINLRGRSIGGDAGVLDLEADPYPFDRFKRIATVPTDKRGRFDTGDLTEVNTRYRVVQVLGGHAASPVVTVYVHPIPKSTYLDESPTVSLVHFVVRTGRADARAGRVYVYSGHGKKNPVWRRATAARSRVAGPSRVDVQARVRVDPRAPGDVFVCAVDGFGAGLGRGTTPMGRCGDKVLHADRWKLLPKL